MFKNKLIPADADKREAICLALKSILRTQGPGLRFGGLALLNWPVIGYSLQMSNTDWVDPIFKPTRIAANVNNCDMFFLMSLSDSFWYLVVCVSSGATLMQALCFQ